MRKIIVTVAVMLGLSGPVLAQEGAPPAAAAEVAAPEVTPSAPTSPAAAPAPVPDAAPETSAPTTPPDVIDDPGAVFQGARDVYGELGALAAIVFVLWAVVGTASRRAKPGTWLDRGRLPMILAMVAASLGFALAAWRGAISWDAALGGVLIAIGTQLPVPVGRS